LLHLENIHTLGHRGQVFPAPRQYQPARRACRHRGPKDERTLFVLTTGSNSGSVALAVLRHSTLDHLANDRLHVRLRKRSQGLGANVAEGTGAQSKRGNGRAEGFRGHYDMLSERCHPNSLGHNFMFSKLDRSDGTVRFYDEREPARNGQMILGALVPLPLAESISARLDELIDKVSDLHHRVAPVSGPGGEPRSS
jgi:hypothetical protein